MRKTSIERKLLFDLTEASSSSSTLTISFGFFDRIVRKFQCRFQSMELERPIMEDVIFCQTILMLQQNG
ncbi:hypothetical protein AY599_12300 [Leptolyngbya valderiana BDU 20041]|nr:hypothetical protein AY599_12300 [Leptolyngbya valderiana BDU 20041]